MHATSNSDNCSQLEDHFNQFAFIPMRHMQVCIAAVPHSKLYCIILPPTLHSYTKSVLQHSQHPKQVLSTYSVVQCHVFPLCCMLHVSVPTTLPPRCASHTKSSLHYTSKGVLHSTLATHSTKNVLSTVIFPLCYGYCMFHTCNHQRNFCCPPKVCFTHQLNLHYTTGMCFQCELLVCWSNYQCFSTCMYSTYRDMV